MQHYSNIHRVSHLASTHPRVSSVTPHKINKRLEPSEFNKQGRCTKYHQSPWDLEITLKESGAQMHVGCTVSKVAANLLSFWWTLVHRHGWTEQVKSIGEAIFFDITEIQHKGLAVQGNVVRIVAEETTIPGSGGFSSTDQPRSSSNAGVAPVDAHTTEAETKPKQKIRLAWP